MLQVMNLEHGSTMSRTNGGYLTCGVHNQKSQHEHNEERVQLTRDFAKIALHHYIGELLREIEPCHTLKDEENRVARYSTQSIRKVDQEMKLLGTKKKSSKCVKREVRFHVSNFSKLTTALPMKYIKVGRIRHSREAILPLHHTNVIFTILCVCYGCNYFYLECYFSHIFNWIFEFSPKQHKFSTCSFIN